MAKPLIDVAGPPTPCKGCEFLPECHTYPVLEQLIYSRNGFLNPPPDDAQMQLLVASARAWIATVDASDLTDDLKRHAALPALFDLMMSGLYAQTLFNAGTRELRRKGFVHAGMEAWAYHPYIWMCPACVAEGHPPRDCYLPDPEIKQDRRGSGPLKAYERAILLSRPGGRLIGDYGYLGIRAILAALLPDDTHITTGGGHRGEFDLVLSADEQLILGEVKASPLVAFPLAAKMPVEAVEHHGWVEAMPLAISWALFIGAAAEGSRYLALPAPAGAAWPLDALVEIARDADKVAPIVTAWHRHLVGYRLFNLEDPATRWHRFGCGNIANPGAAPGEPVELRVGNTKNLPGIDRTDDIKKGAAQVMLFARLKPGCRKEAVKTVLFGNLFAETHHEHYVRPIASLRLEWPGERPVWLFDGIVALSRNILNDSSLDVFFGLPNEPYPLAEEVSEEALLAAVTAEGEETGE